MNAFQLLSESVQKIFLKLYQVAGVKKWIKVTIWNGNGTFLGPKMQK